MILDCEIGEEILIDGDVKLKLLELRGKQVCLGIEAPRSRSIHREEVYQRIKAKEPIKIKEPVEA